MKFTNVLVAVSLAFVGSQAFAGGKKEHGGMAPNCEVGTKKKHVKDKATCEKEKGKWLEAGAKPAAAKPADAAGEEAAPVEGTP